MTPSQPEHKSGALRRFAIGYALVIPLSAVIVVIDAFVWHWLPWAFALVVLYGVWMIPWMLDGTTWRQAWQERRS